MRFSGREISAQFNDKKSKTEIKNVFKNIENGAETVTVR